MDTVQEPVLLQHGITGAGFDDRLGCYLAYTLQEQYPHYFDMLLCDYEEQGQSTAEYFIPTHKYNFVIELDREGFDFVDYGLASAEFCKEFEHTTGIKQDWGSFSDICELQNVDCSKINLGTGCYSSHSRNSGFSPLVCQSQIRGLMEFVEVYKDTYFKQGAGYSFGYAAGYTYKYKDYTTPLNYKGSNERDDNPLDDPLYDQRFESANDYYLKRNELEYGDKLDPDTIYFPCEICTKPTPEYMYDNDLKCLCCPSCMEEIHSDTVVSPDNQSSDDPMHEYEYFPALHDAVQNQLNEDAESDTLEYTIIELWMRCENWKDFCKAIHIRDDIIKDGVGSFKIRVPIDTLLEYGIIDEDEIH